MPFSFQAKEFFIHILNYALILINGTWVFVKLIFSVLTLYVIKFLGHYFNMGCYILILFFFFWVDGGRWTKRVYDTLLLDAGGTLLQLAKPVEEIYATIGSKYG